MCIRQTHDIWLVYTGLLQGNPSKPTAAKCSVTSCRTGNLRSGDGVPPGAPDPRGSAAFGPGSPPGRPTLGKVRPLARLRTGNLRSGDSVQMMFRWCSDGVQMVFRRCSDDDLKKAVGRIPLQNTASVRASLPRAVADHCKQANGSEMLC